MEEDVGAKAPVTRLRRRLSVEQSEEVKSPAPSTPSKKRGGRLAAKPQLELIIENAPENGTKKPTKKSAAKDVIEASEDKVLTPSRRSTRIKSNTSLVSDTPQAVDSPRAKRAARRNSQIGSDNEAPSTPVRQTRRTRKDSTSSIEKLETVTSAKKTTIIADSIIEEESNSQQSKENLKAEVTPKRKSPRLQKKNNHSEMDNEDLQQTNNNTPDTKSTSKSKIPDDSITLRNSLDERPVNKTNLHSDIKTQVEEKADDYNTNKYKNKLNTSSNTQSTETEKEDKDLHNLSSDNKKRSSVSTNNSKLDDDLPNKYGTEKLQLNISSDTINNKVLNETEKLFEKAPIAAVQSIIYFEDSDSDSRGKPVSNEQMMENEDQCVPVVPKINQKTTDVSILNQNGNDKMSYNDTCEPMDIDETMPTNVSSINSSNSNQDKEVDKSILENAKEKLIKSPNNSKQESTASLSTSQNNDKIENENKSTLILSQLKDVSTTDNSLSKTPKLAVSALSKSVTEINHNKDSKDSVYMTSTPLQQKNLKKMAMQINTSIINNSNSSQQSYPKKNNDKKMDIESADDSSEEESDSEHVSTKENSGFLDDEAEEAGDDYVSGDSQDEDEKQYEKENEILEKGETLDSDDDASNDSDYEKDSFVVSADEEDNELLSGSGNDLSMSDNELTMSKKSKKKFDERKMKERKKASKEMYEARHNTSNNSSVVESIKQKKNRRQRLNSSTLVSEEEIVLKSKKGKIMKLDSSQDSSDEDIDIESTKNVSLSKEHEITSVCDESIMTKNDPLSIKVKIEPQTPLKDLDMSTVPILDKIEEVQLNQNVSILKANETSDPLQEDSDASSISENMEISSNYDSVLKELNKEVDNKKIKSLDMSLNLNKKSKKKSKEPIVENLNLTTTKKSKRDVNTDAKSCNILTNANKEIKSKTDFDESSSDSIDLKLLFSEDSSDSIKKNSESEQKPQNEPDSFIPLKRTEAKTNIPDGMNTSRNQSQDTSITSNKKKKKNSLSFDDEANGNNITSSNLEISINNTLNISVKKKKSVSLNNSNYGSQDQEVAQTEIDHDQSLNASSKKKKRLSISDITSATENQNDQEVLLNQSNHNQSLNSSTKKKKNNSKFGNDKTETTTNYDNLNDNKQEVSQGQKDHELSMNTTLNTSSKKNKKKRSISMADIEIPENNTKLNESVTKNTLDLSINSTLNTSSKKKNKNSASVDDISIDIIDKKIDISLNKSNLDISRNSALNTSSKKKKNDSMSGDIASESENIQSVSDVLNKSTNELTESSKKKKRHNSSVTAESNHTIEEVDNKCNDSMNTSTKKKKAKTIEIKVAQDCDSDAPEEIPYESHKNTSAGDSSGGIFIDTEGNQDWNTILTSGSSKKKNKKKKQVQESSSQANEISYETNNEEPAKSKKRKRNTSANSTSQETVTADSETLDGSVNTENKRKKLKISLSKEAITENQDITKKQNKKRKDRDDDNTDRKTKVFKQNIADKVSVPRLPTAILNQLEDKPKKDVLEKKKAKVVSTTQFVVEEAKKRKNKPSNYLEESVYLNDSSDEKKQKGFIKIPKVLPFVPTATISGNGFTTKFQINVLPKETKFVAQTSNMAGFKNEYLGGRKLKKVGTYELYKSQRNRKMTKF